MDPLIIVIVTIFIIIIYKIKNKENNNVFSWTQHTKKEIKNNDIRGKNPQSSAKYITEKTDKWIDAVTVNNDPKKVYELFCDNAVLLGTVSQISRRKEEIKKYFDYFAKLPNIKVVNKSYNITEVSDSALQGNRVFMNNAFITWEWGTNAKDKTTVTARMTFLYKNNCIQLLHSSKLPNFNDQLFNISGNK